MTIHSTLKDYTVDFTDGILHQRDWLFNKRPNSRYFFFIDAAVARHYHEDLARLVGKDFLLDIEALETNKEYGALARVYQVLVDAGFQRRDTLVAIGGGVLQDITGFIASTLYRGVSWLFIPTTLLAQADSCIGSKTSINLGETKNLIGSFYPPNAIAIDVGFCETLTDAYFNSGLGEIIKYHLMVDDAAYERLTTYLNTKDLRARDVLDSILRSSLAIKKTFIEGDEFDTGRRNLLNYGHCIGHALESASNFGVSHGEAVIVGMGFANLVSNRRGMLSNDLYEAMERLLRPHYPRFNLSAVSIDDLLQYLGRDKKRVGSGLTMILSRGIGRQEKCDDLTPEEVRATHIDFLKRYPPP